MAVTEDKVSPGINTTTYYNHGQEPPFFQLEDHINTSGSLTASTTTNPEDNTTTVNTNLDDNYRDYMFDPSRITHVYHIGWSRRYGRTNNNIITILHVVDMALDNHGSGDNNDADCPAVVSVLGWAAQLLQDFFFNPEKDSEWSLELEKLKPVRIVNEKRLDALGLSQNKTTHEFIHAKHAYWYGHETWRKTNVVEKERRRRSILGPLFRNVGEKNLVGYNVLREYLEEQQKTRIGTRGGANSTKNLPSKYVAVHSRWMEGQCEKRVGGLLPKDECWMPPSYIHELVGGTIDYPIVFISDGQNEQVLDRLKRDADIAPHLILPKDLPTMKNISMSLNQPITDMMIAIHSEIFIGTRVSSMAIVVGMVRVILGKDPASNLIFVGRKKASEKGNGATVEVCEECLFLWNETQSNLCGSEAMLA